MSEMDLFVKIETSAKQLLAEVSSARRSLNPGLTGDAEKAEKELADIGSAGEASGQRAAAAFGGLRAAMATLGLAALANDFVSANVAVEGNRLALEALTGSQQAAAEAMTYLYGLADRLGTSAAGLSEQYVSLTAATKGTALEGQATRDVFEAIVGAMGKLGKSGAETSRALTAVSQISSKGVVSMEELRGQLGEALPGAMQSLASAMGVTVEQLGEMVATGDLLAADVLPKLAEGLNTTFQLDGVARIDSLSASLERFKNAASRALTEPGQGGLGDAFSALLDLGADGLTGATAGMVTLGKNIGAVAAYASGSISSWDELTQAIEENNTAGQAFIDGAGQSGEAAQSLAGDVGTAAKAVDDLAASQQRAADALKALGTDRATLETGITKAGREAIAAFDAIATSGEYSADAVARAFEIASKKAGPAGFEELKKVVESVYGSGALKAGEFSTAIDEVAAALKRQAEAAAKVGATKAGVDPASQSDDAGKDTKSDYAEEQAANLYRFQQHEIDRAEFETNVKELDAAKEGRKIGPQEAAAREYSLENGGYGAETNSVGAPGEAPQEVEVTLVPNEKWILDLQEKLKKELITVPVKLEPQGGGTFEEALKDAAAARGHRP